MTTSEYISQLQERLERLKNGEHVFIAVSATHADVSRRIFEDGKAVDDKEIGSYDSQNEIYINTAINAPKKLKPVGKTGESVFSNGKPHKTTYFKSYSDFRAKQGRESKKVNLSLNNFLKLDFTNGLTRIGKNNFVVKFKQAINTKKAYGNESRFNKKIFGLTTKEQAILAQTIQFESLRIMQGL